MKTAMRAIRTARVAALSAVFLGFATGVFSAPGGFYANQIPQPRTINQDEDRARKQRAFAETLSELQAARDHQKIMRQHEARMQKPSEQTVDQKIFQSIAQDAARHNPPPSFSDLEPVDVSRSPASSVVNPNMAEDTGEGGDYKDPAEIERAIKEGVQANWRNIQLDSFKSSPGIEFPKQERKDEKKKTNLESVDVFEAGPVGGEKHIISPGTIIPAIMITGIISDLPGYITAQVSENVYDTADGKYVLIPQGTRLFGEYNSTVEFGQKRVMIRWQRLIFPDASTVDLKGMPGVDQQGFSGLKGNVNTHFWPRFTTAIMTSVFAAAADKLDKDVDAKVEIKNSVIAFNNDIPVGAVTLYAGKNIPSGWHLCNGEKVAATETAYIRVVGSNAKYPDLTAPSGLVYIVKTRDSVANGTISKGNSRVWANIANAIAEMASSVYQKHLNRQPTIVIKQGQRFSVMVNKEMHLPVWKNVENRLQRNY